MSDAQSCSEKILANLQKKGAFDRFVGTTDPLEEVGTASSPFGGDSYRIRAWNKWDLHIFRGGGSAPPTSALGADTEISRAQ